MDCGVGRSGMAVLRGGEVVVRVHRPSLGEKLFFLLSGAVSSVPLTLFVSQFVDSLLGSLSLFYAVLLSAVVVAPFVEEFAKAFPLLYRHGETERSIFTLGLLVGLGFGLVEFLLYVFVLGVPPVYRIDGVVFHAASTSITAYGIAKGRAASFYLVAVVLHFSNNFFAFVFSLADTTVQFGPWSLGTYAVMAATLYLSLRLYKRTSEKIAA
jgi:RsiW-degrading membrane proteinase PrsW (M82 family)